MKKHGRIIIIVFALLGLFLAKNYILFDRQPFDDLNPGEIEKATLTSSSLASQWEIPQVEISDIPVLMEKLARQQVTRKTNEAHQQDYKCGVTVTLYMKDGSEIMAHIDNIHIQTDSGIYINQPEPAEEFLRYAFEKLIIGDKPMANTDPARINHLVEMALDGKDITEIRKYVAEELTVGNFGKADLNILATDGYTDIDVFITDDAHQQNLLGIASRQQYKTLAEDMFEKYKTDSVAADYRFKKPPLDFKFPDKFNADDISIEKGKRDLYYITLPSADKKYDMCITIDDGKAKDSYGTVTETTADVEYVNFYLHSDTAVPADYPPVDITKNGSALVSADILTEKITSCMVTGSKPEKPSFHKTMFICSINYIDDPRFCYYNIFPLLPDQSGSQFKTSNTERVVQQVFGDYSWSATKNFREESDYNPQTLSYEFSTDFGWGVMFWSARNISSSFSADGKQVYSVFDLSGPDPAITTDPEYKEYGKYRAVYDIVTEDGETFLRFNKYEKI